VGVTRGMHMVETEHARLEMIQRFALVLDRGGVLKFSGIEGAEGQRRYIDSDAPLIGRPEQLITSLRRLEEGGADLVLMADITGSSKGLRSFARDVMPAFDNQSMLVSVA